LGELNHDKESIIHFGGNLLDGWMQSAFIEGRR
jgi:hypothetical protein